MDRVAVEEMVISPVPDAPQTMMQNWIPFFTFFLRRILIALPAADIVLGVGYLGGGVLANVLAVATCSAGGAG